VFLKKVLELKVHLATKDKDRQWSILAEQLFECDTFKAYRKVTVRALKNKFVRWVILALVRSFMNRCGHTL
ncbi:MAG TPA: hypothetical protein VHD33_06145, partial [Legionellaceae bacterium]|nr:hypothetical protein [Legionellaceae bacterium]